MTVMKALPQVCVDIEEIVRSDVALQKGIGIWPSSKMHLKPARDHFLDRLVLLHDDKFAADETAQLIVRTLSAFWTTMVIQMGYCNSLAAAIDSANIDMNCGQRNAMLGEFLNGSMPPQPATLQHLIDGPPRYPLWRWPFRIARQAAVKSQIVSSPLLGRYEDTGPVILSTGGLIEAHARATGELLQLCDLHNWFLPAKNATSTGYEHLAQAVTEAASQALSLIGKGLNPGLSDRFEDYFLATARLLATHYQRLRSCERLPRRLWIGTSSDLWARLLGFEVLRRGGEVVAHDHGFASGFYDEPGIPLITKGFCSELLTFEDVQISHLQKTLRDEGFKTPIIPQVTSLQSIMNNGQERSIYDRISRDLDPANKLKKPKKVMLMPLPLCGDHMGIVPHADDVWAQDLNLALIRHLQELDLEILLKPHPEFDVAPFRTIAESLGAKLIEGRFEEQIHLADVFVFTHPMSSTVKFGLEKKLPMIVIDFGFTRWFPEMKEKLENNIQFVEGFMDEDFRLRYDRNGLAAIL